MYAMRESCVLSAIDSRFKARISFEQITVHRIKVKKYAKGITMLLKNSIDNSCPIFPFLVEFTR